MTIVICKITVRKFKFHMKARTQDFNERVCWLSNMFAMFMYFPSLQMNIFDKNKDGRLDLNDLAR